MCIAATRAMSVPECGHMRNKYTPMGQTDRQLLREGAAQGGLARPRWPMQQNNTIPRDDVDCRSRQVLYRRKWGETLTVDVRIAEHYCGVDVIQQPRLDVV